jgi:nitroimidazol reductase NimA-like FMN-containing flavoprotein (pyridoxamine 5'-phosphate oxidase superfamily)
MGSKQGDIALLNEPVAQELLQSTNIAQLAYVWRDGSPRVIPIWFHWTGDKFVFAGPVEAPKIKVIADQKVAVTINSFSWPYKVLLIRGTARVNTVEGIAPEYAAAAYRYHGQDGGKAWLQQVEALGTEQMARIEVKPEWVGLMDFETRFPSALEAAMEAAQQRQA